MRKSINSWNAALVMILSIILVINIGNILTDASNPKDTAWEVKLNVTSDAGGKDNAMFGAADNATDGFDVYWDEPEAPMGVYILAYFWYPDNPPGFQKLSTSYIKLTNSMTWPLKIELIDIGNNSVANVTVQWNMTDIGKWPSDSDITLETPDGEINMRTNSSYTYKNLSTGYHNFTITCFIEKLPDDEEENGGIPGFEIGILVVSLLFSITYLLIKKKR